MKKIGILTYHHALNYGTLLQAYATQRIIEKEGYESEFINYQQRNKYSLSDKIVLRIKRIPTYLFDIKKYYFKRKMMGQLEKWKNGMRAFTAQMLKEGKQLYLDVEDIEKDPPVYDGYVVGSDQTWNQNVTNNTDVLYLSFVEESNRKGCYAPSIGVSELSDKQKRRYVHLLSDFNYLSCREKTGATLLTEILGRHVECVLDPTLMIKKEDWITFSRPVEVKRPYILTYFLGETKWYREFAIEIASALSTDIINIPTNYLDFMDKRTLKAWANPQEFVYLINQADLVLTDSFHGTVLSINMNKQFYSFIKNSYDDVKSQSSRIVDILDVLGLSNRLLTEESAHEVLSHRSIEINYGTPNDLLEQERNQSMIYLRNMLMGITK